MLYGSLDAFLNYDPEDAAVLRTESYLVAAYADPTASQQDSVPSCGGCWAAEDCWLLLQDAVVKASGQYSLTAVYYNWEDSSVPWRGGDEIIVQVDFPQGRPILVYTYESCVDYCFYKPDDWTYPSRLR
jgi:hypothetical protein